MALFRKKVTDVFTPRSKNVNSSVYVPRVEYEELLADSLSGSLHTIVCGESGSGKSWMCKQVLDEGDYTSFNVNCGNIHRYGSLTEALYRSIIPAGQLVKKSQTDELKAEASVVIAKAKGGSSHVYEVVEEDPLLSVFKHAYRTAGSTTPVIVIENLENIVKDEKLMAELGDVLLLLDDDCFADYEVKFLLIGVPNNILDFYRNLDRFASICNRLEEIPPVRSLTVEQVGDFLKLSFIEALKIKVPKSEHEDWARVIHSRSLGLAQKVQEYSLRLARLISKNKWEHYPEMWFEADVAFLKSALHQSYLVVDRCMNKRATVTARRNQVLYALAQTNDTEFEAAGVEQYVRELFPNSTKDVKLGISKILSELATESMGLLCKSNNARTYRMGDPTYLMCLRIILYVPKDSETVEKMILNR